MTTLPDIIDFYSPTGKWFEFSNFFKSPIVYDLITYPSSEHFFQSKKFTDEWYKNQIIQASTSMKAKIIATQKIQSGYKWKTDLNPIIREGIKRGIKIIDNWDNLRDDIMYQIVKIKFSQNGELKTLLLSTGTAIIQENSPRDSYWGLGHDGKGLNKLGLILMRIRDEL